MRTVHPELARWPTEPPDPRRPPPNGSRRGLPHSICRFEDRPLPLHILVLPQFFTVNLRNSSCGVTPLVSPKDQVRRPKIGPISQADLGYPAQPPRLVINKHQAPCSLLSPTRYIVLLSSCLSIDRFILPTGASGTSNPDPISSSHLPIHHVRQVPGGDHPRGRQCRRQARGPGASRR